MGGGEVLKKGWLVKSPPLEGGGMKSWRKRYFVLRSSKILEYYKSENGGDIKGVVNLEDCISVHADLFHRKYKHVFDIQTRDRTYYLVAPSTEEMRDWVVTLCKVCEFTTQEAPKGVSRGSSTLPGNFSVTKTPLPEPPNASSVGTKFSPEMEQYLLSPEVVELVRCKPKDTVVPAGIPFQEALVQKGLTGNNSRTSSYSNSARTSIGSNITESSCNSRRSSQDFSSRFSTTSSIDGHSDSNSFTYDTPTNNQPAVNPPIPDHYDTPTNNQLATNHYDTPTNNQLATSHYDTPTNNQLATNPQVPSHYAVPRSSLGTISSSGPIYKVPRSARMSDPLLWYDPHHQPTRLDGYNSHYDFPPRRETFLPPRGEIPLPPRATEVPLPPRNIPHRPQPDTSHNNGGFSSNTQNIYDVPPHPIPVIIDPQPNGSYNVSSSLPHDVSLSNSLPIMGRSSSPRRQSGGSSSSGSRGEPRRQSIDTIDCPIPPPTQGNLLPPPPSIIFRKDSKTLADDMVPNEMYEMVWAGKEDLDIEDLPVDEGREDLEETLKVSNENEEETKSSSPLPVKNTYVNLSVLEEVPPPVDRSLKPIPTGPKIDRSNKPQTTISMDVTDGFESIQPSSNNASQEGGVPADDIFLAKEIPRLTSHSVHYTQVSFEQRAKKPVPTPRSNCTPNASPQRRVNYSHIDIDAINSSFNELKLTQEEGTSDKRLSLSDS